MKKRLENNNFDHSVKHPLLHNQPSLAQKSSDIIAKFGGSWTFIFVYCALVLCWIALNVLILTTKPFDPYPFILLNLMISIMTSLHAPIILMSQNRQEERDRLTAKYDYQVDRKSEREIIELKKELLEIKQILKK